MNWFVTINKRVIYPVEKKTGLLCIKAVDLASLPVQPGMYNVIAKPYNSVGNETYINNVKIPCILKTFIITNSSYSAQYFDENEYWQFDFSSVDSVEFQICDSKGNIHNDVIGCLKIVVKDM